MRFTVLHHLPIAELGGGGGGGVRQVYSTRDQLTFFACMYVQNFNLCGVALAKRAVGIHAVSTLKTVIAMAGMLCSVRKTPPNS